MHPNALKSIESHINLALQACSVQDGWLIFDSYTNEVHSLSQEIIKHKREWLTVTSCYFIFSDYVKSYLKRKFSDPKGVSGRLKDLLDEDEIIELKTSIVDFIQSIPRAYEIYFPLPSFNDSEINNIELSESLFIKKFNVGDTLPSGGTANLLAVGVTYFVIKASGYAKSSIDDIAFRESLSSLKVLLHMCLILNLIKLQEPAVSLASVAEFLSKGLYVHSNEAIIIDLANQNEISGSIRLPLPIASQI
jgi:hypothetical protein